MERTVPRTGGEEIELYIRTYYSLLRSSGEVAIKALVEAHAGMKSSLHVGADDPMPDLSAFLYAANRLPDCIRDVRLVLLGQSQSVFARRGYAGVEAWAEVTAPGRRRRTFYDGEETLAMYIASRSDIDDIIPTLTAFQIEWNKLQILIRSSAQLQGFLEAELETGGPPDAETLATLAGGMGIPLTELERLHALWGDELVEWLHTIAVHEKAMAVKLLAGSLTDYRKATQHWWTHVQRDVPEVDFGTCPLYFVSSNTHSIVNLCSGYALRRKEPLLAFIDEVGHEELLAEYHDIEAQHVPSSRENFLYYTLRQYLNANGDSAREARLSEEQQVGIHRVRSHQTFDVDAQVIQLNKLRPDWIDPRLRLDGIERLAGSPAVILNIDYPLGMAAYQLLSQIAQSVGMLAGVYVMGKAATLNGRVGDVMIPQVVHDEHSQNTYLFDNCFKAGDVAPHLVYGNVLDTQKSFTARGTFLQNPTYMGVFYREGYTDIEMEAGPYMSAIYENVRPIRYPTNEIVTLYNAPFEIGFLHYASDMPLRTGKTLGAGSLSYRGMDPTYATSIAILRRIIAREIEAVAERERQGASL